MSQITLTSINYYSLSLLVYLMLILARKSANVVKIPVFSF